MTTGDSRTSNLFSPVLLGELTLPNRIVMAPMTRCRAPASGGHVATPLMCRYYAQRADAGLLITEGTQVSPRGIGYVDTPGIHSAEQARAWAVVTRAVRERGGRIVAQLWHVGRVSHPEFHGGALPVAPSALPVNASIYTPRGKRDIPIPHELSISEIETVVAEFARAAERAMEAGFDGVELHAANGYLIEQFLCDGSNKRTDMYGGGAQNRIRFALEAFDAVAKVVGGGRVGIRLSPHGQSYGIADTNRMETVAALAAELGRRRLAFVHLVEPPKATPRFAPHIRARAHCSIIINGGYTLRTAAAVIENGSADAVSFAALFLANPDLVERLRRGGPFNAPDESTYYGGDERGYTDYPTLSEPPIRG